MTRKRPGGNFGNFGASSFSKDETPKLKKYKVKPIQGAFGGSVPDSLYTSNKESAWARWRRGWELAAANGVLRPFFYDFKYKIPGDQDTIIGNRSPFLSGALQGFLTENSEYGMHWAGRVNAGNLRFDNLKDQFNVRLAISGEVPYETPFLSSGQDNTNFWYVQLSGTFDATNPFPPPLFVTLPLGDQIKPINGDILEDTIITVSGEPVDSDTRDPATAKRYGFVQAVLTDLDQNQGILKLRKLGSVQSTIDGVLQTPSRIPFESGRFLQTGARYACSCQDFTRRNYAYLSSLGLRTGQKFAHSKCATIKPGREEEMKLQGQILNAAQTEIMDGVVKNRLMTIVYPSGETFNYPLPGVTFTETGKDIRNSNTLYRDLPAVFQEFGSIYQRGFGDKPNPSGVAEGMPKYGDYKQSGLAITEISDFWTYTLDQYRYCKHIYAMRYADGVFPNEPSDFPVEVGLMSAWEGRLVEKTRNSQTKAFEKLAYYGLGYMDTPPFNLQSPKMTPMLQRLINIPQDFIALQNFFMVDKDGNAYNIASGQVPVSAGQPSGFQISNWDFPSGTNY
tara:strand:+ start:5987 stop:7678 length:1692 start_codon:yes stop_codon:yes gene_type:complete